MLSAHPALTNLFTEAIDKGDIPGCIAIYGSSQDMTAALCFGLRRYGGETVNKDTYYDLASLTKVISTLPAILKLVSEKEIKLSDTVDRFFANAGWFQTPSLGQVSLKELLTHSSGLAAWKPLFAWISERKTGLANVLQSGLEEPPGKFVYSDLGFITLGAIIERISKQQQDQFVKEQLFEPLGLASLRYGPISKTNVAATEDCGWRNEILEGVVHDENAYCLGQIAGHAGLFGQAQDVARYAQAWLRLEAKLGEEAILRDSFKEHLNQDGVRRGLGWALKGTNAFSGSHSSAKGYGHTGFTGTSVWLEPEQDWFAVLLSNRIHPSRHNGSAVHALRQQFHNIVAEVFA